MVPNPETRPQRCGTLLRNLHGSPVTPGTLVAATRWVALPRVLRQPTAATSPKRFLACAFNDIKAGGPNDRLTRAPMPCYVSVSLPLSTEARNTLGRRSDRLPGTAGLRACERPAFLQRPADSARQAFRLDSCLRRNDADSAISRTLMSFHLSRGVSPRSGARSDLPRSKLRGILWPPSRYGRGRFPPHSKLGGIQRVPNDRVCSDSLPNDRGPE